MNGKRILIVFLAATLASSFNSMTAFAAFKKKIRTVKLEIAGDIIPGGSIMHQQMDITVENERYEVLDYVFTNQGLEWSNTDVPMLEVTLRSIPECYFETEDYGFFINGGTYVKQIKEEEVKDDDNEWKKTIKVVVELPPVSDYMEEIQDAQWRDSHTASWTKPVGAGSYEVILYRNGKKTGTIKRTEGTTIDLEKYMTKVGNYSFRVRPVNERNTEIKGEWAEAASMYIDNKAGEFNRLITKAPGGWYKIRMAGGMKMKMETIRSMTGKI